MTQVLVQAAEATPGNPQATTAPPSRISFFREATVFTWAFIAAS
jgi:hypothetical protein